MAEERIECIGCKRAPNAILEYRHYAKIKGITPEKVVRTQEGTFNRFEPNRFYCTKCYIEAGMPSYGGASRD